MRPEPKVKVHIYREKQELLDRLGYMDVYVHMRMIMGEDSQLSKKCLTALHSLQTDRAKVRQVNYQHGGSHYTVKPAQYSSEMQAMLLAVADAESKVKKETLGELESLNAKSLDEGYVDKIMDKLDGRHNELFKKTFLQKTKFKKLNGKNQREFLGILSESIRATDGNPHLSNQFAKFVNMPRNFIVVTQTRDMEGWGKTVQTTKGLAHLGHCKDEKSAELAIRQWVDANEADSSDGESAAVVEGKKFKFPGSSDFKHSYTALVDSGLIGGTSGESTMNTNVLNAVTRMNKEYDLAKEYDDTISKYGNELPVEVINEKIKVLSRSVGFKKAGAREQIATLEKKLEVMDEAIKLGLGDFSKRQKAIQRGKILFTRTAMYNTVFQSGRAAEKGNIWTRNPDLLAEVKTQRDNLNKFIDGMASSTKVRADKAKKDLRKVYAGHMPYEDFKREYPGLDVTQEDIVKFARFSTKLEMFDATNNSKYNKRWAFRTNAHVMHTAATSGLIQAIFDKNSGEGCKSNKDRASELRKQTQAQDKCAQEDENWTISDGSWQEYAQKNNNLDELIKEAESKSLSSLMESKETTPDSDTEKVRVLIELKKDLLYADSYVSVDEPSSIKNKEEEKRKGGYFNFVTKWCAIGTWGAMAQVRLADDKNFRGMMPQRQVKIYEATRPEFLLKKQFDNIAANMNKGPNEKDVYNAYRLHEKVKKEYDQYVGGLNGNGISEIQKGAKGVLAIRHDLAIRQEEDKKIEIAERLEILSAKDPNPVVFMEEIKLRNQIDEINKNIQRLRGSSTDSNQEISFEDAMGILAKASYGDIMKLEGGDKELLLKARHQAATMETAEVGRDLINEVYVDSHAQSRKPSTDSSERPEGLLYFASQLKIAQAKSWISTLTFGWGDKEKNEKINRLVSQMTKDRENYTSAQQIKKIKNSATRTEMIDHLSKVVLAHMMVDEMEKGGQQATAVEAANTGKITDEHRKKLIDEIVGKIEGKTSEQGPYHNHKEVLMQMEEKGNAGLVSDRVSDLEEEDVATTKPRVSTAKNELDQMRTNLGLAKESVRGMYNDIKNKSEGNSTVGQDRNDNGPG